MQTSPNGRKLLESFEGLSLNAYLDQRGILTIGFGHTAGVDPGDTCTAAEADAFLEDDLKTAEGAVSACVHYPLNQNQFDSLVSLCYNIGAGAFGKSTLVSLLNQGAVAGAANQFLVWNRVSGVINQGLLNRRMIEKKLFLTPEE
jgi:lysozyme